MCQRIPPIMVFYSYAPEDEKLCYRLRQHLSLLEREAWICQRHDHLTPTTIDSIQDTAQTPLKPAIIFLLISSNFIASHRCYEIEMPDALQRHREDTAYVIPIILRPCDWQTAPFAELACLPHGGKPVTQWNDLDRAFTEIARNLRVILEKPL